MTDEKQMNDPLTPAEVVAIQELIADRHEEMVAQVTAAIDAAVGTLHAQVDALASQVATMQEALQILDGAAVKIGGKVAFRAAKGKLMCAENGGPSDEGALFKLEARSSAGEWESFGVERGV